MGNQCCEKTTIDETTELRMIQPTNSEATTGSKPNAVIDDDLPFDINEVSNMPVKKIKT